MTIEHYVGFLAGFFTTIAFIPQAYRIYKIQETKDISLLTFVIFTLGLIFWLIYGYMLNSLPMIVSNSITLIMSVYILYKKIKDMLKEWKRSTIE